MTTRFYIGLAATLHDPAIAIVNSEGEVVFAEALERPLQEKRAWNQPPDAMGHISRIVLEYCGQDAELTVGVNWSQSLANKLRATEILELPWIEPWLGRLTKHTFSKKDHQIWPLKGYWPLLKSLRNSVTQAGSNLEWQGLIAPKSKILGFNHHLTHAVTAAVSSDVDHGLCAIVDGFGEGISIGYFMYEKGQVKPLGNPKKYLQKKSGSLGMFYGMLCHLCGFDPILGEEWKVMGLAPYGKHNPHIDDLMRPMLKVDGINLLQGITPKEYWARIRKLEAFRPQKDAGFEVAADIAYTGHVIYCDLMRSLISNLYDTGLSDTLLLGGGCALNSAWNGKIIDETPFKTLCVPSAPADDGCAIGTAHLARLQKQPNSLIPAQPCGFSLGSRAEEHALDRLIKYGLPEGISVEQVDIPKKVAQLLSNGKIVGWMQGRAEFGPRALGHRSIIADPRDSGIKERLNSEVKFREPFRPFAPAILDEYGSEWFESYTSSPHMERTFHFKPEKLTIVPGVVHVDNTGRVQSVNQEASPTFHAMIREFHIITGVPLVLNTSLNRMGKPIVHAVEDALGLFLTTGLDAIAIEDVVLVKSEVNATVATKFSHR